jgi:hypothetical protein
VNDVGLVQDTPTRENIPATLDALSKMYPFDERVLSHLAQTISRLGCRLVICDISPLGIAAAQRANIPSVLVENFRWDWIYQNYQQFSPRFTGYINYLQHIFESADHLIQSEPVCIRHNADLTTPPISRLPRTGKIEVRASLGIQPHEKMIYISMGGSGWDTSFLKDIQEQGRYVFIISGGSMPAQKLGNVIFLDVNTYMPDVLAACDAVVSKAGYSTLAEVYYAGIPFGYITRQHFEETRILEEFIRSEMQGMKIDEADLYSGAFVRSMDELLSLPCIKRDSVLHGAQLAAQYITNLT